MNGTANRTPVEALLRHFADLRDGNHGGVSERTAKEALFGVAVELMDPVVRAVLAEVDTALLLGTGTAAATGVQRDGTGGLTAQWTLTWPEQRDADLPPIGVTAHYGSDFHHPHLRGVTVGEWPLNVFDQGDARAELPTVWAIVAADLHNLVFQRTFRIIPATTRG
jgi:hypothetical protein